MMYTPLYYPKIVKHKSHVSGCPKKTTLPPKELTAKYMGNNKMTGIVDSRGYRPLNEVPSLAEERPAYRAAGKYLDPYSMLGFRKIFNDKDLLIPFLRCLLHREPAGSQLNCYPAGVLGRSREEPLGLFDLYSDVGEAERFIIEMQHDYYPNVILRSIYYMPVLFANRAPGYDYRLRNSYLIEILNFSLGDEDTYKREIRLMDTSSKEFLKKPTIFFLEMPKFSKREDELESGLDKWLYALKNLHSFKERPEILFEDEFKWLFEKTSIANLTPEEMEQFNKSVRING